MKIKFFKYFERLRKNLEKFFRFGQGRLLSLTGLSLLYEKFKINFSKKFLIFFPSFFKVFN
jgi:hypothetical protein